MTYQRETEYRVSEEVASKRVRPLILCTLRVLKISLSPPRLSEGYAGSSRALESANSS
jgi:hypothetical protein